MGIRAELKVHGQTVTLADPSGGIFNAAGDFDRLLPVTGEAFPILARIGPFSDVVIAAADLASLASEAAQLLRQADEGAERRGLLRLRTLALAGQGQPGAELWIVGD